MADRTNEELLGELFTATMNMTSELRMDGDEARYDKARAAVLARMAGPGEVVVPVEPTPKMIEAAENTAELGHDRDGDEFNLYSPREVWCAMLAARPNNGGKDDQAK